MLRDYLRSAWRGMLHHKVATLINIGGLALGLLVFFALLLYVHREFSWDAQWEDADRIYRLTGRQESPQGNSPAFLSGAPWVVGETLQSRHPDAFLEYARVTFQSGTLSVGDERYPRRSITYTEPSFLRLFQLEQVEGSLEEVFADPRSVAVSTQVVESAFAGVSPLGKTLTYISDQGEQQDYTVRAVYELPQPSVLASVQVLAVFDPAALPVRNSTIEGWAQWSGTPPQALLSFTHYLKLRADAVPASIENDLRAFMDEHKYEEFGPNKMRYILQPLQDVHLSPGPFDAGDNVQRLQVFLAVGVLVLLISGCNFVMLATLRAVDRMREVGLRKTVGGQTGQLMCQYLVDAFCQTLLAAVLAVGLLELGLPRLQTLLDLSLPLDLVTLPGLGLCLAIVLGFTLLSSAYPAWILARGKPAVLFRKGSGAVVSSGNALRRLLVGLQFSIVVVLLLASAVVQQQIDYTQNRDRGFSLERVVALRLGSVEQFSKTSALARELSHVPGVEVAAVGGMGPGAVRIGSPPQVWRSSSSGERIEAVIQNDSVGIGYFRTLSVALLAGRDFSEGVEGAAAPASGSDPPPQLDVLLNESAVLALGFDTPEAALDQLLETNITRSAGGTAVQALRVIGVVADTQLASVMLPPLPQYYRYTGSGGFVAVKLEAGTDRAAVTAAMETPWREVMGAVPFAPLAPELLEGNMLRREQFEARIIIGSTVLAVVIALLGLYGLVAATVLKRVKEIGLRKVMGAERSAIVALLLWQFSQPVVLANLLAWPLGYWGVIQWLQRFPFQLDTGVIALSGIAASVVALVVAWTIVGIMALRAASVRPVQALRYE